ncbi:MAG: hypothetical protein LBR07_07455 [Puniceicoccales bacterium]|jgi:hypothetical protein|nr:hypothetical protein [Puniceicoccales bacterium]
MRTLPAVAFFAALALWQMVWIFFGLEPADTGWHLSFYQQFFSHPEAHEFDFLYWLSGLVGSVWMHVFPEGGLLWVRVLGLLFETATAALVFLCLRRVFSPETALLSVALVVFSHAGLPAHFFYNPFSVFLLLLGVFLLLKGLRETRLLPVFFAGFVLSASIFARVPNLLGLSLAALIVLNYLLCRQEDGALRQLARQGAAFTGGAICGLLAPLLLVFTLGQGDVLRNALEILFAKGADGADAHGIANMLSYAFHNYLKVFQNGVPWSIPLTLVLTVFALSRITARPVRAAVLLAAFLVLAFLLNYQFWTARFFAFYFIAIVTGGAFLLTKIARVQREKTLLCAAGLLLLVLFPFGSDCYIYSAGMYAVWLAFPFSCALLVETVLSRTADRTNVLPVLCVAFAAFFAVASHQAACNPFFAPGRITERTAQIKNSTLLRGVFVKPATAENLDSLLSELKKHVAAGDALLCYESIPLVHYLTDTRPYARTSWPLFYPASLFAKKLSEAEQREPERPFVVISKQSRGAGRFDLQRNYLDETKLDYPLFSRERLRVLKDFLRRNEYRPVFENDYFALWAPAAGQRTTGKEPQKKKE